MISANYGSIDPTATSPSTAADDLVRVLGQAAERPYASLELLHSAVGAFVRELRSRGTPPEQVLQTTEAVFRRAAPERAPRSRARSLAALTAREVRWYIAHYYEAGDDVA